MDKFKEVVLERRQGQIKSKTVKSIDMLAQAKSFIAIWERSPHKSIQYVDTALDNYRERLKNDPCFIEKSLFSGILWSELSNFIPVPLVNARFHILSCIAFLMLEKIFHVDNLLLLSDKEIDEKLLKLGKDNFFECFAKIGPIKMNDISKNVFNAVFRWTGQDEKNTAKIHHRKFYPTSTLEELYKELKGFNSENKTSSIQLEFKL